MLFFIEDLIESDIYDVVRDVDFDNSESFEIEYLEYEFFDDPLFESLKSSFAF